MSQKKSNAGSSLLAYSHKDFKDADRLNRLRMYMIEPGKFDLNSEDWEYYIFLEGCFHLVINELSRTVAVQKIKTAYPDITHSHAIIAYENVSELFGTVVDTNRRIQKGKITERLAILADKAYQNAIFFVKVENEDGSVDEKEVCDKEWFEISRKLMADIATIERYDKEVPILDPTMFQIPPLIITSDPEAFLRSRREENEEDDAT